jgi:hypothetical protein
MLMDNFTNNYVDLCQLKEAERMREKVLKVWKRMTGDTSQSKFKRVT